MSGCTGFGWFAHVGGWCQISLRVGFSAGFDLNRSGCLVAALLFIATRLIRTNRRSLLPEIRVAVVGLLIVTSHLIDLTPQCCETGSLHLKGLLLRQSLHY